METVESITETLGKSEEKESEDASAAAGLLEKLSVAESKTEKASEEAPAASVKAEESSEVEKP